MAPGLEDLVGTTLAHQCGVVTRAQLLAAGASPSDIRRALRRRELSAHLPGVYVDHTGPLTPVQRRWVAVLAVWPAALCHRSATRAEEPPGTNIDVAVDRHRSPAPPPGVRLHHLAGLHEQVQWNASPPRVRLETALIQLASEARDDLDAIAIVADAVQARRTTPARLENALDTRRRVARRRLLKGILRDVAAGSCSVLEQGYLERVERAHGLPTADRQVRVSARGVLYRDVEYRNQGVIVELDGRLFHDDARSRDRDLERDLDAALDQSVTVRLGWGQVFGVGRACITTTKLDRLLRQRGWSDHAIACPECPR